MISYSDEDDYDKNNIKQVQAMTGPYVTTKVTILYIVLRSSAANKSKANAMQMKNCLYTLFFNNIQVAGFRLHIWSNILV